MSDRNPAKYNKIIQQDDEIKWFDYLKAKGKNDDKIPRTSDNTILLAFPDIHCNEQDDRLIVQRRYDRKHAAFDSISKYLKYIEAHPGCYDEAILNRRPRRLIFDIDCSDSTVFTGSIRKADIMADRNKYIDDLLECIQAHLSEHYNSNIFCPIIMDSSDESKFSLHIVLYGIAVANAAEAKHFTTTLRESLPDHLRAILDPNVNKKTQYFRMLLSTKDGRKLTIINKDLNYMDTLASYCPQADLLPLKVTKEGDSVENDNEPIYDIPRELLAKIEQNMPDIANFRYYRTKGNLIAYGRTSPSTDCPVCGNGANHANIGMFLRVYTNRVVRYCSSAKGIGKSIVILEEDNIADTLGIKLDPRTQQPARAKLPLREYIKTIKSSIIRPPSEYKRLDIKIDELPTDTIINYLIDEKTQTLLVISPMGTGKTISLRKYLESLSVKQPVIFVSFRRSFTIKIVADFTLTNYEKIKEHQISGIIYPRLAIQYDSLHRLNLTTFKNSIVIMDESELVIRQINSQLLKHSVACWEVFQFLITSQLTTVIALDARMDKLTFDLLKKRANPVLLVNAPENHKKLDVILYESYIAFREKILKCLNNEHCELSPKGDNPIVIACTSKDVGGMIMKAILEVAPTKKVKFYSGDSPDEDRNALCDLERAWGDLDVLIYTSTISAGMSFLAKRYHMFFGYFTSRSTDHKTATQMLRRVRNINTNEYHIYIDSPNTNIPHRRADIIEALSYQSSANSLYREIDINQEALPARYIDYITCKRKFHKDLYFDTYMNNATFSAESRKFFRYKLLQEFVSIGANLRVSDDKIDDKVLLKAIKTKLRADKQIIKNTPLEEIAAAEDLSPEELYELGRMTDKSKLTKEQRNSLQKNKILKTYERSTESTASDQIKEFICKYGAPALLAEYKRYRKFITMDHVDSFRVNSLQEVSKLNDDIHECSSSVEQIANSREYQNSQFNKNSIIQDCLDILMPNTNVKQLYMHSHDVSIVKKEELVAYFVKYSKRICGIFGGNEFTPSEYDLRNFNKILAHIGLELSQIRKKINKKNVTTHYTLHKSLPFANNFVPNTMLTHLVPAP